MKHPDALTVPVQADAATTAFVYRADDKAGAALVLAHGAGAPQRSPWIVNLAQALTTRGLDVVTFNFLYTEQRRKFPDRRPLMTETGRKAPAYVHAMLL